MRPRKASNAVPPCVHAWTLSPSLPLSTLSCDSDGRILPLSSGFSDEPPCDTNSVGSRFRPSLNLVHRISSCGVAIRAMENDFRQSNYGKDYSIVWRNKAIQFLTVFYCIFDLQTALGYRQSIFCFSCSVRGKSKTESIMAWYKVSFHRGLHDSIGTSTLSRGSSCDVMVNVLLLGCLILIGRGCRIALFHD